MALLYTKLLVPCLLILSISTSVSSQQRSKEATYLSFNHLYLYVDSNTYHGIMNNSFLKTEFATYEHRTTTREDYSYTAVYYYGTNTYFEFFDAGADTGAQEGDCGIALGVENVDDLSLIADQISDSLSFQVDSVSRQWEEKYIPWFSYIAFEEPFVEDDLSLYIWIMEYQPEFLKGWHPKQDSPPAGITRKVVLDRYKDVLESRNSHPIMSDVIGVTFAADSLETLRLVEFFDDVGYDIEHASGKTILSSQSVSFNIVPESDSLRGLTEMLINTTGKPRGIDQIDFSEKSTLRFLSDSLAVWSFQYPVRRE